EVLHEIHRRLVPARREPHDAPVAAMTVNGLVIGAGELDSPLVIDVGHSTPGRVALDLPLVARHAELGRALLELHGVAPGERGAVDELLGELERAVVVDSDLGDDENRLAGADEIRADTDDGFAHTGPPCVVVPARSARIHSAKSRNAPCPPRAAAWWWTAFRTAGNASAGAAVRPKVPTRTRVSRSFMSS